MEVRCSGCNQKYVIPDDRLADRMAYFACEKCGSTVALRPRDGQSRGGAAGGLSAKDMLEGIYLSFNLKNLLISAVALFSISFLFILVYSVAVNNADLAAGWPGAAQALVFIGAFIGFLVFDLHLYLVSKNTAHRLTHGGNIDFSMAQSEIINDLKPVGIISAGVLAAYLVVLAPIALPGNGRVLYGGLVYPVLVPLSIAVVVIQSMKGLLFAFIALKQRTMVSTVKDLFHFIAVENINLPLYLLFINMVSGIFFLLIIACAGAGLMLTSGMISRFAGGEFYNLPVSLFAGGGQGIAWGAMESMPAAVKAGIMLILIFSFLLILFAAAYYISLYQALSVSAVSIMEANPGRSISRAAVLASMIVLGLAAGTAILFYSASIARAAFP
jgi:hypothetical protein